MGVPVDPLRAQPEASRGAGADPDSIRNLDTSGYMLHGLLTSEAEDEARILVEERDFLIVHKPAGMHCLPGSGPKSADGTDAAVVSSISNGEAADPLPAEAPTLSGWLCRRYPELATENAKAARTVGSPQTANGKAQARSFDSGLLSRLDHDTSGLILVARSHSALEGFLGLQASGRIEKRYAFLGSPSSQGLPGSRPLCAEPDPRIVLPWRDSGTLRSGATARNRPLPGWPFVLTSRFRPYGPGRRVVAAIGEGIEPPRGCDVAPGLYSSTFVDSLEYATSPHAATWLCLVAIHRGFRHQIRAHAAWLGLPILGDTLYGGQPDTRLRLHSCAIAFPGSGGKVFRFGAWT